MNNKECSDAVCALVPPKERVVVTEGRIRNCQLTGGKTVYEYMIHATDIIAVSEESYQDVFDSWKCQMADMRKRKIANLKKQLGALESAGEVEA